MKIILIYIAMEVIILLYSQDDEGKINYPKHYFNVLIKNYVKVIINIIMIIIIIMKFIHKAIVVKAIRGYYAKNVILIMKRA